MLRTVALFTLLIHIVASSQTSIGFKSPNHSRPLTSYRLPSWGYKTFKTSFQASGKGRSVDEYKAAEYGVFTSVDASYRWFRESDIDRVSLRCGVDMSHEIDKGLSMAFHEDEFSYAGRLSSMANLSLDAERFYKGQHFVFSASIEPGVEKAREFIPPAVPEEDDWGDGKKTLISWVVGRAALGYGLGRIRNVTPVIHSLRFRERFRALGLPQRISDVQVQEIAGIFSKCMGYFAVYDRGHKFFWDDVFRVLGVDALSPFQFYYLQDALREQIGSRYEGWQVDLRATFTGRHRQSSEKGSSKELGTKIGINGRWYKNLNLNHQISLRLFPGYEKETMADDEAAYFSVDLRLEHLWCLADRLLLVSYFLMDYNKDKPVYSDYKVEDGWRVRREAILGATLTYYVENKFSISTKANAAYDHTDLDWRFRFFINYFIDRSLR